MTKAFIGFILSMAVPWASNAVAQTDQSQPAAKIVVDAPLAEPLSRGVVFIEYQLVRVRNVALAPRQVWHQRVG